MAAIEAQGRVGIMLNVRRADLAGVLGLLPALQRPTISPLSDDEWVAVNTIIEERTVRDLIPKFQAMAKEANRDLASLPISIWESKEDEGELKRDQDAGVVRVIVSLESEKADKILPILDRWSKLAAKVA